MRLEPMEKRVRVYLSPSEYELLLNSAPNKACYFASRLEAECSPRIGQVAKIERGDFYVPDDPNVELVFLTLRGTKDTTAGESPLGGQARITWVPQDLYEELTQWADQRGLSEDDQFFDVGARRLGDYVVEMRENAVTKSGNEDYFHVTSHDFRVYYATNMVRRHRVNLEIVMEMGGWTSKKAIEPYLQKPLARDIQDELVRTELVSGEELPEPPQRDDLHGLYSELRKLRELLNLDDSGLLDDFTASEIKELHEMAIKERTDEQAGEGETRNASLTEFDDEEGVASDPVSRQLASRLNKERTAAIESDKIIYPLPAKRAAVLSVGLLALAVIWGLALANSGAFLFDPFTGNVQITPGGAIGFALSAVMIIRETPKL